MAQDLLFPEFGPTELDPDDLARRADQVLDQRSAVPASGLREQQLRARRFDSAVGPLVALTTERGLAALTFVSAEGLDGTLREAERRYGRHAAVGDCPHLDQTVAELGEYFAGERKRFEMALDVRGTPFQLDVWGELRRIPYGKVTSYSEIAGAIGKPTATRAVGAANGKNRIAVVLPCHRVVGANGTLTGYAGGLWRKRRLLELELEGVGLK